MQEKQVLNTSRRQSAYHRLGDPAAPKLVLIHGNAASSAFFFPTITMLAEHFDVLAPDLNGFGDTQASPIHAPTALADWAEDVDALVSALGFEHFALLGWSLGGGVAQRYAILHPQKLSHLVLLSPMSPYGFGGSKGLDGQMYDERGWGAPGGFANPQFLEMLAQKDQGEEPFSPRTVLKGLFADGWPLGEQWQQLYLDELFKLRLGEDYYPGKVEALPVFPYVLPGTRGISNALAPQYANVSAIVDISPKPPILWIRGDKDGLVSDRSYGDLATLGAMGLLPGYPGEESFPPQPMVAQTRAVLQRYQEQGGFFQEEVFENCAHASHLEAPERFVDLLKNFIKG